MYFSVSGGARGVGEGNQQQNGELLEVDHNAYTQTEREKMVSLAPRMF